MITLRDPCEIISATVWCLTFFTGYSVHKARKINAENESVITFHFISTKDNFFRHAPSFFKLWFIIDLKLIIETLIRYYGKMNDSEIVHVEYYIIVLSPPGWAALSSAERGWRATGKYLEKQNLAQHSLVKKSCAHIPVILSV